MIRTKQKKLALCLASGTLAVASLAIADVVILNPGEMTGQISFSAETVTSYRVDALSSDGVSAYGIYTSNQYSLTVESGHNYSPSVKAYFSNPGAYESYLTVSRSAAVLVDNQVGPTSVDFNYPTTHHTNFTINVTGGTIDNYTIYASTSTSAESYSARTSNNFSNPKPSFMTSWLAMVPNSQVNVYGTVSLTLASGTQVWRSLSPQTVDLLSGPAGVSWDIDLTTVGTLAGEVELTAGSTISNHYVYFNGIYNTPTDGISGARYVSANGPYTIDLLPGEYDVYLQTFFYPSQQIETTRYRVTIAQGVTTTHDFIETLGTGLAPLVVSGFFTNADLDLASLYLTDQSGVWAYHHAPVAGQYVFSLPSAVWKRSGINYWIYDVSDPQLPVDNRSTRYHYNNSTVLPVMVPSGATVNLGAEEVTLVKSNAFFDVKEATPQDPPILLSSPRVQLYGYEYNGDGSLKAHRSITASGSSEPRSLSALTMVAEPGTYVMQAYATVDGSVARFPDRSITFGQPVPTNIGTNVLITPTLATEDAKVELTFPAVMGNGITTVVESPLGPPPPEGFHLHCDDSSPEFSCEPMYYDIKTTAQVTWPVTVCVRMKFPGGNGVEGFLHLLHYNENEPDPAKRWADLPPPPAPKQRVTNCFEDLEECGCGESDDCGIDLESDPPVFAYMVCGETMSFSPFVLATGGLKFTNEVDNIEYEGPNGPTSLQTWTVPATGTYRIMAKGARGAAAAQAQVSGGCGAEVSGDFSLQEGDVLQILVGQKGISAPYSGGGGGGSFVVLNGTPLLIAGGGGGARSGALVHGRHGSIQPSGVAGSTNANYTSGYIAGGTNGSGGAKLSSYGSGGGGWSGNGAFDGSYGEGGFSFLTGSKGGAGKSCGAPAHGGYGGGGAGNGCYGGGGGGGYSGGGGGRVAGGGGSWNAGSNQQNRQGMEGSFLLCTPSGHGEVTIELSRE